MLTHAKKHEISALSFFCYANDLSVMHNFKVTLIFSIFMKNTILFSMSMNFMSKNNEGKLLALLKDFKLVEQTKRFWVTFIVFGMVHLSTQSLHCTAFELTGCAGH